MYELCALSSNCLHCFAAAEYTKSNLWKHYYASYNRAFGVQLHKRRNDTQSWAHKVWTRALESYSTFQRWALALKFVCFSYIGPLSIVHKCILMLAAWNIDSKRIYCIYIYVAVGSKSIRWQTKHLLRFIFIRFIVK